MNIRQKLLQKLIDRPSILAQVINSSAELEIATKSTIFQAEIISRLEAIATDVAVNRAAFIKSSQPKLFDENRSSWGIPEFAEDIVNSQDFKNGFLWRFRAHTTSWSDNQFADQWFYTSLEARSVIRYEFWSCDNGSDELEFFIEGNYKIILEQLLQEQVYEVLISPAFSAEDLSKFIAAYKEEDGDYLLEELMKDYISQNPNYSLT